MSKLYKAYAAVHSKDIKEELYSKKDQISEMNLDQLTDSDLVEITEEIIQGMFDYGCTTQNAIDFVTETLKSVTYENSPERRSVKIERITEAFNITFERITDKAKTTSIEEFNNYRKSKPLIEKWNNRVNHEIGNQKVHGSLIAKDREFIKSSLSSLIYEKMDKSYEVVDEMNTELSTIKQKFKDKMTKSSVVKRFKDRGESKREFRNSYKKDIDGGYVGPHKPTKSNLKTALKKQNESVQNALNALDTYMKMHEHHQKDANGKVTEHGDGTPSSVEEAKVDTVKYGTLSSPAKEKARNERKFGKLGWNQGGQSQLRKGSHWTNRGEKKVRGAKQEENVAELYKGKHGQTEKEYQDSRSDAGKMISGDSKGSGASYSYKAKNTGPNPAGGSKKPEGQARMSSKDRQYLKYRKSMMKKEEIEFVNKLVESGKFSSVEIAKIADIQEADIADIIARLEKK